MVDLVITAANVLAGAGAVIDHGKAGEAVTAGKVVYKDPATSRYMLADSNSITAAAKVPTGIALNGAALGQPLAVHSDGPITIGAAVVAGTDYWLSDTPGGICPRADVGSGETATLLGLAKSTTVIDISIETSGVTI